MLKLSPQVVLGEPITPKTVSFLFVENGTVKFAILVYCVAEILFSPFKSIANLTLVAEVSLNL